MGWKSQYQKQLVDFFGVQVGYNEGLSLESSFMKWGKEDLRDIFDGRIIVVVSREDVGLWIGWCYLLVLGSLVLFL